jgi:DNA-binding PadR family transcriptional regulator
MLNEDWHPFLKGLGMGRHFGRRWERHWGRGDWMGGAGMAWGPGRVRRGDMKYRILELLAERPRHGYDVIRDLEERHEGYRASAGSVYPTLQMLEDGGFVTSEISEGKRVYTITDAGRELLAQRATGEAPDDEDGDSHAPWHELRASAFALAAAVMQVARERDPAKLAHVREILNRARREIYAILASEP